MNKKIVSFDIGSTFTKGGVFELGENRALKLNKRIAVPTTQETLTDGVDKLFYELIGASLEQSKQDYEIVYSSSAKGGLAVVASGIVPDLTLEAAKMTAVSAGAKICGVYAYKMTRKDVEHIRESSPDILLLTGGTDGGNESYVIHNAEMLAELSIDVAIVYAGNRSLRDQVESILTGRECYFVDNVLPEFDVFNPEPARLCIQNIFLEKIVKGKGLGELIESLGSKPWPTPYAILEFINKVCKKYPDLEEFCVLDLGGATTDVYSYVKSTVADGAVYKGVPELNIKRTVEGDLGMRFSATGMCNTFENSIKENLKNSETMECFRQYLKTIGECYEYVAVGDDECRFDNIIAQLGCAEALKRHAGSLKEIYTPQGKVLVQKGRNLRNVALVLGTGAQLAFKDNFPLDKVLNMVSDSDGSGTILVPEMCVFKRDRFYILPLLANISFKYSEEAIKAFIDMIKN